jgi:hypothetical protein
VAEAIMTTSDVILGIACGLVILFFASLLWSMLDEQVDRLSGVVKLPWYRRIFWRKTIRDLMAESESGKRAEISGDVEGSKTNAHLMRSISKADIVGARVVEIHGTYELLDGWLDCCTIYFTVDRGFTFVAPVAGMAWTSEELPKNAKRLEDEKVIEGFEVKRGWFGLTRLVRLPSTTNDTVKQIKQRTIAGVYCEPFDEEIGCHYPDGGILVFNDGSQASNTVVAPQGTGSAGLYFRPGSECTPLAELVDFFTIPIENQT